VLRTHGNLNANGVDSPVRPASVDVDFQQFHDAWEWLESERSQNHHRGRHDWVSSSPLAQTCAKSLGRPISNGAMIAAGYELGVKSRRGRGFDMEFNLPPIAQSGKHK
jgi:hypothetical protein